MKNNKEDIGKITYDKLIELTKNERDVALEEFKRCIVELANHPIASNDYFVSFLYDFLDVYDKLYDETGPRNGNVNELIDWSKFNDSRDDLWIVKCCNAMTEYNSLCRINRFLREVGKL